MQNTNFEEVIRAANRLNRTVLVFLMGRTGTGKTTLALSLAEAFAEVYPLCTGLRCREKFGEQIFMEGEESLTPDVSEAFTRQLIEDAITCPPNKVVVIDSFPRSVEQIPWVVDLLKAQKTVSPLFAYCICEEATRQKRLTERNAAGSLAEELSKKRDKEEPAKLLGVVEALIETGVDVVSLSLTEDSRLMAYQTLVDQRIMLERLMQETSPSLSKAPVKLRVYLAGPVYNHNTGREDTPQNWKRSLMRRLEGLDFIEWVDPLQRQGQGVHNRSSAFFDVIEKDLKDITEADAVIALAGASNGTAMEVFYATRFVGIPVLLLVPFGVKPSPWLLFHAKQTSYEVRGYKGRTFAEYADEWLTELAKAKGLTE